MLRWTLFFFIFSVVAGVLGFSSLSVTTSGIAQVLFYVFLCLFVLSLLGRVANRGDKFINTSL